MNEYTYLNGKFIKHKDAKIHIEDRGIQFADSVYEVVPFYNKKLIDTKFHLQRLRISLLALDIKYKFNDKKLISIFCKLINIDNIKNGIIYLQITRGVQPRSHVYKNNLKPTIIIYTQSKSFNIPNKNFKGVEVITHEDLRWSRADLKTVNLLPNILAENLAYKKNKYTAILIKKNRITEGTHSNIWIIKKTGLKLKENSFTKEQLYNADEVFITSSGSFITPVIKVDNKNINKGAIGNITFKLATLYFKSVKNEKI